MCSDKKDVMLFDEMGKGNVKRDEERCVSVDGWMDGMRMRCTHLTGQEIIQHKKGVISNIQPTSRLFISQLRDISIDVI
jgi:hypothetical protein